MSKIQDEETVIGVHTSGIELQEGMNTSLSRNYCTNCKRKIHCYVKVDRDTKEAKIHITCKSQDCECKCRTHYACKSCNHLHPYGQDCNRAEPETPSNPESEKLFQELMDKWRKQGEEKSTPKAKP